MRVIVFMPSKVKCSFQVPAVWFSATADWYGISQCFFISGFGLTVLRMSFDFRIITVCIVCVTVLKTLSSDSRVSRKASGRWTLQSSILVGWKYFPSATWPPFSVLNKNAYSCHSRWIFDQNYVAFVAHVSWSQLDIMTLNDSDQQRLFCL